jgi:superfamily II DNA or RNA helicase
MNFTLYAPQQTFYDDINVAFETNKSVCGVLPTGGGKSVIIAEFCKNWTGRTLVLTHRIEILSQNAKWLPNAGTLSSKDNNTRFDNTVIFAMVQTLASRIQKFGIDYLGKFDNIILDEVHILIFEKVFQQYKPKRLLGFTGTPVLNKKIMTNIDGVDYIEPFTLSVLFEVMVQGADTQDLINEGILVQDYNIVLDLPDIKKLKTSKNAPDGYTAESLNAVYNNTASLNVLSKAYNDYCQGKKTVIFNATTKVNKFIYDYLKEKGVNVMMYDSINDAEINEETGSKWTRDEVITWFKEQKDAVLINTNVFTTGFDDTDIEVIIMNRATKSLSLYIQCVGRGSRVSKNILKDKFTHLDLGGNIEEHGRWSERRNWEDYFHSSGRVLHKKSDLLSTWDCLSCFAINIIGTEKCAECGAEKENVVINGKSKKNKEGVLKALEDFPIPNGGKIVEYTTNLNEDSNFAFKLAEQKIMDLFQYYNVTPEFYSGRANRFEKRIKSIYRNMYFAIINSDLPGANKKLEAMYQRVFDKIEKKYGK